MIRISIPFRKLLSALLLPLALSACTAGSDTSLSPVDPITPIAPDGGDTDSVTVSISSVRIVPYGSQASVTRAGSKTLLSEQIMIEDTWTDSLTLRTRSTDYAPTPIATLTLAEEFVPADTRAEASPAGLNMLLFAFRANPSGDRQCVLWSRCCLYSDGSIRHLLINGIPTSGDKQGLKLLKGNYRFYILACSNSASISPGDDAYTTVFGTDPTKLSWEDIRIPSGLWYTDTDGGTECYISDSGEISLTGPMPPLDIVLRPVFSRVKVNIDCSGLWSRVTDILNDSYAAAVRTIMVTPQILNSQSELSLCLKNTSVSYQLEKGTKSISIDTNNGTFTATYYLSPSGGAPLRIPYNTDNSNKNLCDYLYLPPLATKENVTLEPGKSYELTLKMSDLYAKVAGTGDPKLDELWWAMGYLNRSHQINTSRPSTYDTSDYVEFRSDTDDPCSQISETVGEGWRLPTKTEATSISNLCQSYTQSYYHYLPSPFPVVRLYQAGYWTVMKPGSPSLSNEYYAFFPVKEGGMKTVYGPSDPNGKSITSFGNPYLSVLCVKGPEHN